MTEYVPQKLTEHILPLRDIHVPHDFLGWPLAIGWWFIITLCFVLFVGYFLFFYQNKKNKTQQHIIKHAFSVLRKLAVEKNKKRLITHISRLLRRVCISLYGRKQVAGLTGEHWLQFLDRKGKTTDFTQGVGRILVVYPYQKKVDYPRQELLLLVKNWLKNQISQDV